MFVQGFVTAQVVQKDTLVVNDNSLESIIVYSARDSIFNDLKKKQVHLYGDAKIQMDEVNMTAGYILVDMNTNEISASYAFDKDSNKVEFPTFTDGSEVVTAHKLRYNTQTKKGFLEELSIKQDEFYFHMGIAKRHPNDEIHLRQGRLTTCDLEEPHYHFQLSKGVVIPNERIVTGPMNLWVKGIPTPFGLPFALLPTNQKERTSGLLFPEFVPISQYGFGFQNLGYYIPINDNLQTSIYANLYSRGSWGLRNDLDYSKRYGFSGRLSAGFQQFRSGFPENSNSNKVSVNWSHRKEPKSNPYWNFSSSVNFISDNTTKNNLDPINQEYFNNSFNSDININRLFPGKPLTMGMKLSMRQSSTAKSISLISPVFNANLTRVFPFKNLFKVTNKEWKKTIARIGLTYNLEGQNRSNFSDSLLSQGDFQRISDQFLNGISQSAALQTTFGLIGNTVKINPSINYGNKINFQQVEKSYDLAANETLTDTVKRYGMSHEFNMNVSLTTMLYTYYQFIGKKKTKMRHLMTPSVGFRYVPLLNPLISENVGVNQSLVTYSPFERSIYNVGNSSQAAFLNFGINNTFELKYKSDKDTVTGFKKTRIIDQFSINGNYDFMKDSMNLSNITFALRISPVDWLNFVSNATFSPYGWNETNGKTIGAYALANNQGLGRFTTTGLTTALTIAPPKDRKKIQETGERLNTNWNSDFNYFALYPERAIYFDIPWKMSLSHVYTINANQNITTTSPKIYNQVQTLVLNGDLSFTKRWNISGNLNLNLQEFEVTNLYFSLNRNMHCWALSFFWTPIGGNKSFLFSIRNTSSVFKDAKIEIRKPPAFL
jgi:hypothetical protein